MRTLDPDRSALSECACFFILIYTHIYRPVARNLPHVTKVKLSYCSLTLHNVISAKHDVSKHVHSNKCTITGLSPLSTVMCNCQMPRKILTAYVIDMLTLSESHRLFGPTINRKNTAGKSTTVNKQTVTGIYH